MTIKPLPKLYFTTEDQIDPKVLDLYNVPQYVQRTPEWFSHRDQCISASDVASALLQTDKAVGYYIESFGHLDNFDFKRRPKSSCNTYSSKEELILKKCSLGEPFTGNVFTAHGVKFEQIATTIYSQLNQVDVLEFGLLIHPEYSFIGSSPDGISAIGRMLELKCPAVRKVKNHPSLHYFQQTLIQLESTGLDYCDFMDAHFIEYVSYDCWESDAKQFELDNPDAKHHIFGIILKQGDDYIYAPTSCVKLDDFLAWKNENYQGDTEITYYKLQEFYISEVKRSEKWFLDNLGDLRDTWNEILFGRTESGQAFLKAGIEEKEKKKMERKDKKAAKVVMEESIHELFYPIALI